MKYLVAVSGGVDSVVLLDMLVKNCVTASSAALPVSPSWRTRESGAMRPESRDTPAWVNVSSDSAPESLVVAHFEHGIRGEESFGDQRFAQDLAKRYGLEFVTTNASLGPDTSEAEARVSRYDFLRTEAKKLGATIVTAHHADDIVETVAINLTRGTGWRGLAVMDSDICRPLLSMRKHEIVEYAREHYLTWREDSTNQTDAYLRNRIRKQLAELDDDATRQVLALRARQVQIKQQSDDILSELTDSSGRIERKILDMVDPEIADELIRAYCLRQFAVAPPRPARARILEAIQTYHPGKVHQSTDQIDVRVDKHFAYLERRS